MPQFDLLQIERIRRGDEASWNELIARFEGRLLAFVESRLRDRAAAEDVVQETFIGFLNSLPNYDESRPLESYLFSIAAHKLTDHLRRTGRRPAVPLVPTGSSQSEWDPASPRHGPSSLLRSGERVRIEEASLAQAIGEQIERWRERGEWQKMQCLELLFVRGWANKDVAARLSISEQAVANFKFDFLAKLKAAVRKQGLPDGAFPELSEV
ncbi:MAG: RNA polymerase sigma factor [Pirellulales bacterium]